MSNKSVVGLGGFLLGLGIGWLIFKNILVTSSNVAWLLIIFGSIVIVSAVVTPIFPSSQIKNITNGAAGGLILALLLTQGIGLINLIPGTDIGRLPYSATESKQYNGSATFSNIYLKLESINGPVTISAWDKREYRIEATITGRGSTQQEADENLAKLGKELVKEETDDIQKLILQYKSPILLNSHYKISVDVKIPSTSTATLEILTSNGAIKLSNLRGNSITTQTSNGQIILTNIIADTVKASTSNAQINGNVEAVTFTAATSNGRVELILPGTTSGSYDISTSNAAVSITVGQSAAYMLKGSTSNGEVTFNLSGLNYSTNTRTSKEAQSQNYDKSQIKINIEIRTSNANIDIRGSTISF